MSVKPVQVALWIELLAAGLGAAAPRILDADGSLDWSQRRYPRLRSTYARAFFLHRLFPGANWTDELVRDPGDYERLDRGEPRRNLSLVPPGRRAAPARPPYPSFRPRPVRQRPPPSSCPS